MLHSKLCFVENPKPRPRKRATPSRGSTRSIKFKPHPIGRAKESNMRKRALSWAAAVIGAVALMVLISGCDGAGGGGILNAILPDGITEPAGIVPTATGSLTVTTGG